MVTADELLSTGSLSGRRLSRFNTFKTITAANGDRCEVPAFVIVRSGPASDNIAIGRVLEIVQVVGSPAAHDSRADYILLDVFEAKRAAAAYKLPHLQHTNIKQLINGLVSPPLLYTLHANTYGIL